MNCVIYVRHNKDISVYEQFNICAEYAKRYGYSIGGRVLDFESKRFYETVDKITSNKNINILMIYNIKFVFRQYNDYLFYRMYLQTFGKKLIVCE